MLASRASGAFVCLRCQLRRARPIPPAVFLLPPRASFSTSTTRHDAPVDSLAEPPPKPRTKVSKYPLGKIKRRKGKAIRETTAAVDVKTLGEDSEILVLREVDEGPRQIEDQSEPQPPPESLDTPSLLASLKEEAGEVNVTQEKVNERLDDLRPKTHDDPNEPQYLAYSSFLQLHKTLNDGFNFRQLFKYFSVAQGIGRARVGPQVWKGLKDTKKKPAGRTEWQPGTTPLATRLVGGALTLSKQKERRHINKPMLVDQILRKVWNVVLLEEIEASGEIEISLKPWQIALLTAGANPTTLDRIGAMRKAKVEVYWPAEIVRITANKSSAEYAADDIVEDLKNTETKEFHLKPWQKLLDTDILQKGKPLALLSEKDLQMVTKLSGAVVQPTLNNSYMLRGRDKLSVQEAERAIIELLPIRPSSTASIDVLRLRNGGAPYILPAASRHSLHYRYRNLDLGRWSLPVPKSIAQPDPSDRPDHGVRDLEDSSMLDAQTRTVEALAKFQFAQMPSQPNKFITEPADGQAIWEDSPRSVMTATFGQALFPVEQNNTPLHTVMSHPEKFPSAVFSSQVPGLPRMFLGEQLPRSAFPPQPCLHYNFVVSPVKLESPTQGQQYPNLQIQLQAIPGEKVALGGTGITFNSQIHQVLLPDQAVDLRFKGFTSLYLSNPLADERIAAWFEAVRQNIESGDRLTAPDSLQIDIPRWTLPGKRVDGTQPLTYLFTGITYQQTADRMFQGRKLRYALKHGGKLSEKVSRLRLMTKRGTSMIEDAEPFVKSVFELVGKITDANLDTRKLRRTALPRDELSERKRRRMHLQDAPGAGAGAAAGQELTTREEEGAGEAHLNEPVSTKLDADDIDDPYTESMLLESADDQSSVVSEGLESSFRITEESKEQEEREGTLEQPA